MTEAAATTAPWRPSERYPDPAIVALDPSFRKYHLPLSAVDTLVSNRPPSAEFVRCLESADVELVYP